jgi:hypothetical protein
MEVPGRNYTVAETLALIRGKRAVRYWVRRIDRALFEDARRRAVALSRGGVLYVANDIFSRQGRRAINCVHAVTDIAPGFVPETPVLAWGYFGTTSAIAALGRRGRVNGLLPTERRELLALVHIPPWIKSAD